MDNAFLLLDRKQKIQSVFRQYGIDNFYLSYSGGKDSTVLSWIIDQAVPDNRIPRVYADTGIEYNMVRDFVKKQAEKDDRIVIIRPSVPIKKSLEEDGYPFKSKLHSAIVDVYQLDSWSKAHGKPYTITGIMHAEGGRRERATCLAFNKKRLTTFNPLLPISKEWEEWLIKTYQIEICDIYKPPYKFYRTGCKGCPFAIDIQQNLDTLERFFPNEKKQCERIWAPVYAEYRRIGYRFKKDDGKQIAMDLGNQFWNLK
ncbi:phosphoadenosine phosphosulfate reductase family protein [uncultured Pseudoramibacter sp.]|uniref:phosphoadenosine phosphosulfate reductase domain-containing protein n=1 Tax=uncultured Pseudoramibacter sp. TaxID=1623493 RepID=UPI0025ED74DF|nr:phosphoadenosine phosphosulfate reductase family protein [uncultured Pseudoramibacter sp.]